MQNRPIDFTPSISAAIFVYVQIGHNIPARQTDRQTLPKFQMIYEYYKAAMNGYNKVNRELFAFTFYKKRIIFITQHVWSLLSCGSSECGML